MADKKEKPIREDPLLISCRLYYNIGYPEKVDVKNLKMSYNDFIRPEAEPKAKAIC